MVTNHQTMDTCILFNTNIPYLLLSIVKKEPGGVLVMCNYGLEASDYF